MTLFAEFYRSFGWKPPGLSAMVPWRATVAPGILLCKQRHAFLRGYAVRGIDVVGEDPETVGTRMLQANNALKRLDGTWALQAEAQRLPVQIYPQRKARFLVAGLIDVDRRRTMLHDPGSRETCYYCTLTWTPDGEQKHALREFYLASDSFMAHMKALLADLRPLSTAELLTYCKTTVSDRWHPVEEPVAGTDLSQYLCDAAWSAGNYPQWDARLGHRHIRCLTLMGYPARSWATMMQQLEAMDVDFRWCTRWMGIEKHLQDGLLFQRQKDWLGQEMTPWQWSKAATTKRPQRILNEDATRKTEDLGATRQDISADIYGVGNFSTTILTWGKEEDEAETNARQIQHTLERLGFVAKREGSYGSRLPITTRLLHYLAPPHHTAAFLSTHPGNTIDNIRQSLQSTMTLAHLMPGLRAVWPGPEQDEYLQEPPWFIARTETSSHVRIVNHVRDVGHSMLLGNTGAGKSTMLGFGVAQWLMYRHSQATIFDVGRSMRLLTLLMGGLWLDLGAGGVPMQPLRYIDQPLEYRWALEWLLGILERAGLTITGVVQEYLAARLQQVAALDNPDERTLSALLHICQGHARKVEVNVNKGTRDAQGLSRPDPYRRARVETYYDVIRALRPFTKQGEYGHLLDGVQEEVRDSHLVIFEQKSLLETPRFLVPVIQYCFHETERRMTTARPMLLGMEEAALLAMLPQYRDKFDAWLMTLRKEGVSVIFVINSLQQAAQLGLGLLTEENCPTRFYFSNPEALTPHTAKVYDLFGLTHEEKRLIATARVYSDIYYVCRERGRRLFHLNLSPFILDCVARNKDEDHALMDELLQKEGREGFPTAWLRAHGYTEEAKTIEQQKGLGNDEVSEETAYRLHPV